MLPGFDGDFRIGDDADEAVAAAAADDRPPLRRLGVTVPTVPTAPPPRQLRLLRWLLLLVVLVWLSILAGAAYVLQDRIIARWPAAAPWFDATGLRRELLGAGLELRNVRPERAILDGRDVVVVRGVVANVSDRPRPVPPLRLVLKDAAGAAVQDKVEPPPRAELEPGATLVFSLALENPDPRTATIAVTFAPPAGG